MTTYTFTVSNEQMQSSFSNTFVQDEKITYKELDVSCKNDCDEDEGCLICWPESK